MGYSNARITLLRKDVKDLNHLKSNRRRSVKSQKNLTQKLLWFSLIVTLDRREARL
jgi:hypothetical protein